MLVPTRVIPNIITGFTKGVHAFKRDDSNETVVVSTTHLNLPISQSRAYLVNRAGVATLLAQSEGQGKDDSASSIIFNDGTLWLIVAEADPGGSGTTTKIDIYEYASVFPKIEPPSGSVDPVARGTANAALSLAQSTAEALKKLIEVLKGVCNL